MDHSQSKMERRIHPAAMPQRSTREPA